jgi:hypothetical protein
MEYKEAFQIASDVSGKSASLEGGYQAVISALGSIETAIYPLPARLTAIPTTVGWFVTDGRA